MNSMSITGRLTKDPELRSLPGGETKVCELRLAVDGMGRGQEVGYIDVLSYGASGEAAATVLKQGWLVGVAGRLEFNEWTDKDSDAKRSKHTVVGHIEFLNAPREAGDREPEVDGVAF
jgi:single-strand DNA-binding protein